MDLKEFGDLSYPVVGIGKEWHPVAHRIKTFRKNDQVWQIVEIPFNVGSPQSDVFGSADSFRSFFFLIIDSDIRKLRGK